MALQRGTQSWLCLSRTITMVRSRRTRNCALKMKSPPRPAAPRRRKPFSNLGRASWRKDMFVGQMRWASTIPAASFDMTVQAAARHPLRNTGWAASGLWSSTAPAWRLCDRDLQHHSRRQLSLAYPVNGDVRRQRRLSRHPSALITRLCFRRRVELRFSSRE